MSVERFAAGCLLSARNQNTGSSRCPAIRDSNAAYSRADFIAPKNSICYLDRKAYGKAGRFTAIRRTDGLEGWMIEDSADPSNRNPMPSEDFSDGLCNNKNKRRKPHVCMALTSQ
ncbi:hypothetical protein [Neisseria oralis]|uniref:hypothetical protein n=1 Tax=Neisseria oralis TaxID=1107316 RepID=UPI0027DEC484|nr:hypothetical protein [Neisseria oralis]